MLVSWETWDTWTGDMCRVLTGTWMGKRGMKPEGMFWGMRLGELTLVARILCAGEGDKRGRWWEGRGWVGNWGLPKTRWFSRNLGGRPGERGRGRG